MIAKPSLLFLTALSAAAAAIGNTMGLAATPAAKPADAAAPLRSRLGVAIASDIEARDKAVVRRGRALDLREQATRAAEARLKADPGQRPPATAPAAGAQPAAAAVAAAGEPYDELARIYQAMKPVAAALVLEQLDLDVQMNVAQRMRERSTAMILAAMTPKGAATLTMALARRGSPKPAAPTPARGR